MKKTKIICTIGPSSDNYNTLKEMALNGMNVARINMSHGTHESHQEKIDLIKKLRHDLNMPIGILLDTKGPEVRIKTFENKSVEISEGQEYIFTTNDIIGNDKAVSVTFDNLHNELSENDTILVNDGLLVFTVTKIADRDIYAKCIVGGVMSDNKGMHFPNNHLNLEFLSERDKNDLMLAVNNDVDFIAASFVNSKEDIINMREFLESKGLTSVHIISKIESKVGLENLEEITNVSDGIMVARGDLGVELDYYKLPEAQKQIISVSNRLGKDVIVATEMLESMINKVRPTRAEISDVANAVYHETSAVMLSGESAMGKYPIETVKAMATISEYTENAIDYETKMIDKQKYNTDIDRGIAYSASQMAIKSDAKAIVVLEDDGKVTKQISNLRPGMPIISLLSNEKAVNMLTVSWGVYAQVVDTVNNITDLITIAKENVLKYTDIKSGDNFVIVAGAPLSETKEINFLKLEKYLN